MKTRPCIQCEQGTMVLDTRPVQATLGDLKQQVPDVHVIARYA